MLQRFQVTKWLWFLLALYSGPTLSPVRCVSVKVPPKTPSTVEAQAKFFQYRHLPTSEDFDQGHRQGSERHFTERHEKSRPSEGLFSAKVRWGDKKGGYGEHYWDLNHAGHAGNHGGDDYSGHNHDDGSYHDHDDHSPSSNYEGPSDHSDHSYGSEDYDPEKSSYEENGRAKRAHPKIKPEKIQKQHHDDEEQPEEEETRPRSHSHKHKHQPQETSSQEDNDSDDDDQEEEEEEKVYKKSKRTQHRHKQESEDDAPEPPPKEPKKKVVLVVQEKENQENNQYVPQPQVVNRQVDYTKYVPYEGGAGVRQHHHPEVVAASSVPRLFLEPTTGHVVDRATGQAYVLQPIAALGYN